MALDNKLVQNINLRANGDQLLRPIEALGRAINKALGDLNKLSGTMTAGAHKSDDAMRRQIQTLQRLVGEASTLQNILNSSNDRRRNNLFAGLEEQTLGKRALSASKLKRELEGTKTSADALEVRLAQIYKRFNDLANAGRKVGQRDINKALNTEEALKQVRQLERELAKLDSRAKINGGLSPQGTQLRGELQRAQDTLLSRIQNGKRVNWSGEITMVEQLVQKYRALTKAELEAAGAAERAQSKTRASLLQNINLSDSQLRAQLERGASRYRFTPDQARGFNIRSVDQSIDTNINRLSRLQDLMGRAMQQGRSQAVIDRLTKSWGNLSGAISEAIAKRRAFDALPEQKMAKLNEMLFGGGNWKAFGARIAGASLISTGVFAAIGAAQNSAQYIVELDNALAQLQAIAGATDTEMKTLGGSILELGTQTKYSTLEIAGAATQIVQAGYSATETADVLKASLMLASGSGSTAAEGVETMTSSLGAFQLQAGEAAHVADVLMEGLNRSKLSINQMQAALQYAGATANETGMNLEELVAIAGSLANAGIRNGSTIGTGIRQLIVDMQAPTEKFQKELKSLGLTMADIDIRSHSLAEVVRTLTEAGFSAEAAYESFEVRAASAFLAFRGQIDTYDEMSVALTKTGAAARANAEAMDSLSGKWTQTKNTLGELAALFSGPFVNALKGSLDLINLVVGGITDLISSIGMALGATTEWGGAITGVLFPALAGFAVGGPMGAAIGGILGLIGAISGATSANDELAAATNKSMQELLSTRQTVSAVDEAMDRLVQRGDSLKKNHVQLQVEVLNLTTKFEGLASQLDTAKLSYENLMDAMVRYRGLKLQEEAEKAGEVMRDSVAQSRPVLKDLRDNQGSVTGHIKGILNYGPISARGSTALRRVQDYIGQDKSYGSMSGAGLLAETVTLRGLINDVRDLGEGNTYVDKLVASLRYRLQKVEEMAEIRGNINQSIMTQQLATELAGPDGQKRDSFLLTTRQRITQGLSANKAKQGSGDSVLQDAVGQAAAALKELEKQRDAAPTGSARAKALGQAILDLQAEVARVTRQSDRDTEAMMKDSRAGAGESLDAAEVKALVESQFKGSRVTSWQKRSYAEQVRLYNNYKAGKGPLAAKPGTSNHGTGNAIDMAPIAGMSIDQVVAFLEGRGLQITEALVEKNPKTGGSHWHIAWAPKKSQYAKGQDAAAEKAARELQNLLEARAGYEADAAQKRVAKLIAQAKAGNVPVESLRSEFTTANAEYVTTALKEFDVKNPTQGLSSTALEARSLARTALEGKLKEDVEKQFADFFRAIGDQTMDVLSRAVEESSRVLDEALREANKIRKVADRNLAIAGNRTNRNKFGAGTDYILRRRQEAANDNADQREIDARKRQIDQDIASIGKAQVEVDKLPEGEAKKEQLEKIAEAWAKVREQIEVVADLEADLAARTQEMANIPLKERLEGAAQAWLENSGAMDSWAKRAENAVGPLLDNLTDGFTDFFTSIVTGSKSIKAALGDLLKSFATFVMQMIMRALALLVVKEILAAFGIAMPTGAFDGGPVTTTKTSHEAPGKFNGGPIGHLIDGGRVTRGVSNRDSALYNLAEGEHVIRSKSVREIGSDNMEMINKYGKAGLAKVAGAAGNITAIQAPRQETNVFVVQEKQRPPLGKNDILVTIHEDILQGGVTKKLVKQVAQGG